MTRHRRTRPAGVMLVALVTTLLLPTAVVAAPAPCDDHLVTHRPDGTTGDATAVTITAQTLERGAAGWSMVAWEVAPTTDLRVVQVVERGTTSELTRDTTTTDGDVEELRFCGTHQVTGTAAGTDAVATTVAATGAWDGLASDGAGRPVGTSPAVLGLLGATVGAATGGVVLLLSRRSRHDDEVIR